MTPLQEMDAAIAAKREQLAAMEAARKLLAAQHPEPVTDWATAAAWTLENAQARLYGLTYAHVLAAWDALWIELSARKPIEPRYREILAMVNATIAPRFQELSK